MTCKDCIHYEICDPYVSSNESFPEVNGCKCFKDKSRYIETPCKVGDKVYSVVKSYHINESTVVGFHLGKFPDLRGHIRKEYLVCYTSYVLRHIDIEQIGKTVFFTREEAEKALAERSNYGM